MVQLLSAHIVGPTMCVNLTLTFVKDFYELSMILISYELELNLVIK